MFMTWVFQHGDGVTVSGLKRSLLTWRRSLNPTFWTLRSTSSLCPCRCPHLLSTTRWVVAVKLHTHNLIMQHSENDCLCDSLPLQVSMFIVSYRVMLGVFSLCTKQRSWKYALWISTQIPVFIVSYRVMLGVFSHRTKQRSCLFGNMHHEFQQES